MDKNTYGDSPAALVLAEKMTQYENTPSSHYVGRVFGNYHALMHQINIDINDKSIKEKLWNLVCDNYMSKIDDSPTVPDDCKSYINNLFKMAYRKMLAGYYNDEWYDKRSKEPQIDLAELL